MYLAHLNQILNYEVVNIKYGYNPVKKVVLTVEEDIECQRVK